jgi:WD40 repeat protein
VALTLGAMAPPKLNVRAMGEGGAGGGLSPNSLARSLSLHALSHSINNWVHTLLIRQVTDGRVVAVGADRTFAAHRWITPNSSAAGSFTFTSSPASPALPFAIDGDSLPPRRVAAPLAGSITQERMGRCFAVLPDARLLLSCGHWDHSLRCTAVAEGAAVQTLRQHKDVVTCLALAAAGEVLVTGSRDTTLMVWGGAPSRKTRGKVREGKRRAAGSSAATAGAHAPLRLALPSRGGAWAGC